MTDVVSHRFRPHSSDVSNLVWPLVILALCISPLAAQTRFSSFSPPDAGTRKGQGTTPLRVNRGGVIAGFYVDSNNLIHGFLRMPDGTFTEFDAPHFTSTSVTDLNDNNQIVGYGSDTNLHGYLRYPNGRFVAVQVPGSTDTLPNAINNGGEIAGTWYDTAGLRHGFLRDTAGNYTLFDAPGAGTSEHQGTFAQAINTSGEVSGFYQDASDVYHGYIRDGSGNFTSFDAPGSGTKVFSGTLPGAINLSGEVTGFFVDDNLVTHAFVRDSSGTVTAFDAPGADLTLANSINDNGKIAGYWTSNGAARGFLRDATGKLRTFSAPIPKTTTYVTGINNSDRITGYYVLANGCNGGFLD
jgi:hypothetical protein